MIQFLMLVFGKEVAEWVYQKTGGVVSSHTAGLGWTKDNKLVSGVAIEGWNGNNLFIHQRVDSRTSRKFWYAVADYCFNELGCKRITGIVPSDNIKALSLNHNIGFKDEAVLSKAADNGEDMIVQVLWKEDCRLLGWNHG